MGKTIWSLDPKLSTVGPWTTQVGRSLRKDLIQESIGYRIGQKKYTSERYTDIIMIIERYIKCQLRPIDGSINVRKKTKCGSDLENVLS